MADESDLYKQFSDFSYRKILFALMMWEEKKEDEEGVVAAFQNRRNNQFKHRAKRQNSGAPQRSNHFNFGAGSNTSRNGKYLTMLIIHD